jgi:hypothetical protein
MKPFRAAASTEGSGQLTFPTAITMHDRLPATVATVRGSWAFTLTGFAASGSESGLAKLINAEQTARVFSGLGSTASNTVPTTAPFSSTTVGGPPWCPIINGCDDVTPTTAPQDTRTLMPRVPSLAATGLPAESTRRIFIRTSSGRGSYLRLRNEMQPVSQKTAKESSALLS